MINKILKLFKIHFSAEAELIDGTKLFVDGNLETGVAIFVISPDGNIPLLDGDYELKDGSTLTCKDGLIETITEKTTEETESEPEVEMETKGENPVGVITELPDPQAAEGESETSEASKKLQTKIDEITARCDELEKKIGMIESNILTVKASEERFNELDEKIEKITFAKEVKQNQIESDVEESLLDKRLKYISAIRNKK